MAEERERRGNLFECRSANIEYKGHPCLSENKEHMCLNRLGNGEREYQCDRNPHLYHISELRFTNGCLGCHSGCTMQWENGGPCPFIFQHSPPPP
eukprot:4878917-Pyramimonas_sp.AAC.1